MTNSGNQNRNLCVEVTIADDGTWAGAETALSCNVDVECRNPVTVYHSGRDTEHAVFCPVHGKIASFPNYGVFQAFVRFAAEKAVEAYDCDSMSELAA